MGRTFALQTVLSGGAALACTVAGWVANDDAVVRNLLLILSLWPWPAGRLPSGRKGFLWPAYESARYALQ